MKQGQAGRCDACDKAEGADAGGPIPITIEEIFAPEDLGELARWLPGREYRQLLWALEEARHVGGKRARVDLGGRELATVIRALRVANYYITEVQPREDHALRALEVPGIPHSDRLRTYANRMLGRPDRNRSGKRGPTYNPEGLVARYRELIGPAPPNRPEQLIPREWYGLSPGRNTLPVTPREALAVLAQEFDFLPNPENASGERRLAAQKACLRTLGRAVGKLPAKDRPKLPSLPR